MKTKPPLWMLPAVVLSSVFDSANAVHVSTDGHGQALVFPYYTARSGFDTVFSISNSSDAIKAVRMRFHEGRNGRPVLDFNVYLGKRMTWSGAVTANAAGNPVLRTYEHTCTAPQFPDSASYPTAREVAFGNTAYAGTDKAGSTLDRAMEGYFVAIEMSELLTDFGVAPGQPLGAVINAAANCPAISTGWDAGGIFGNAGGAESIAPSGGLTGAGMVINVQEGMTFPMEPTVLSRLFAGKRHTAPGASSPNLGDADPYSVVLTRNGGRIESTWNTGIDAVSAVLMQDRVLNDYASTLS